VSFVSCPPPQPVSTAASTSNSNPAAPCPTSPNRSTPPERRTRVAYRRRYSPCTTREAAPSSLIRYAEIAISGSDTTRITAATAFTSGSDCV
jgi:hypothetical protein